MKEITIGLKGFASTKADSSTLASAVGSGSLNVFSTPYMTALMEKAACNALDKYLENDEATVGTALDIRHTSASPEGMDISAEAVLTEINGREFTFDVTAYDNAGLIGNGTHKRFLVCAERFIEKVNSKLK